MRFKNFLGYFFLCFISITYAQQQKDILFTIEDQSVSTEEFLKVFNKNRDIVAEENKKSIEEYLQLYINYKLKLKQAYDLKYDTVSTYKKELAQYREQLLTPYLKDSKITRSLVKEAYDRTKVEVNASHILVRLLPKASAADTLNAFNKIIEARNKILKGASFEEIAKEYSEDPSAIDNGGNLGYFSAFSMVYPFENAAYNTKINEISMPFKTQFGYHIVKVNDIKDSEGEVEVAHIMIKENPQDSLYAKTKINELYSKLLQNENFELLAKLHSDDKNSAIQGGLLPLFNANRMIQPFADVAFSLKGENEISKPFATPYGWHIVKLIKKHPVKEFNEMKEELTKKIEKSERAKIAGKSVVDKLINEYSITKDDNILQLYFKNDSAAIARNLGNMIFTINGDKTILKDLVTFNAQQRNKSLKESYNEFFDSKILKYYKDNLEKTNKEFAFTLQEYKDGLLLFDVLQDKVWKRADTDTIGLKSFFEKNSTNYQWPKRGDVILASCTKNEKAKLVKKYLEEDKGIDEIKKLVNEGATIHVIFTSGILEENHKKLPKGFIFDEERVSDVFDLGDNNFTVVKVKQIIPPKPMLFKEARGRVVNDFQEYLEQQWIDDLRQRYTVKVHQKVLKRLLKQNLN